MPFHLMVYIRIVLTTLVTITCLLGDNFVELTEHPVLRALVDNGTHAVIGAITGIAFVIQFYEKITNCLGWSLILLCFSTSSLIDLDHFIQARSWNLEVSNLLLYLVDLQKFQILGRYQPHKTSVSSLLDHSNGNFLRLHMDFLPQLFQDKFVAWSVVMRFLHTSHQGCNPQRILAVPIWKHQPYFLYLLHLVDHNDTISGVLHLQPMFQQCRSKISWILDQE